MLTKKVIASLFAAGFLLLFNGGYPTPSKYEGMIIRKIEFVGLKNVDEGDLFAELEDTDIAENYPLKASEMKTAIKKVFHKGEFENVMVEIEEYKDGIRLRFICKERPEIRDIEYKGIEKLSEVDLSTLVLVKEGEVLRINLLEDSIKKIIAKYKEEGYFNAVVEYRLKKDEEKNSVKVVFLIDEGEEIKIEKISILGARKIPADDLIGKMETNENRWFTDGTFRKDKYEEDKGKIIAYYKEKGYLDAQIVEDEVEYEWKDPSAEDERAIFITIKVTEGEKYYFDKYTIAGNKVFDTPTLEEGFEQKDSGDVFNNTKFEMDRQNISFLYASKGYIFARVVPKRTITEREVEDDGVMVTRKFVTINFEIEEGKQAYIEHIIIKGNQKTKDYVIKRELIIEEGELFNSSKVQKSRERVFNLGFFKQVNFDIRPGSREDYMNLIVDVEEQPTGTISLGGGYGTNSGFSIFTDVSENNLLGYGNRVGCRFQYGPNNFSTTISYDNPWLFNYPVSWSLSIFYELYTFNNANSLFGNGTAEYERRSFGYSTGLSYKFFIDYGIGAIWRHSFRSYVNPSGNCSDEIFIDEALGIQEKRTITDYIYWDTRDNYMNPTKGWKAEFAVSFTGGAIIRGDDHFIKYSPDLYFYLTPFHLPFLKTHPCVFELRGNANFIKPPFQRRKIEKMQPNSENPWLELEDRLYLGGPETLRGWDYGASESGFPKSWQNGLYHEILYGAEFRVPIHPQMLWLVLFFDAGSLWSDKFWEGTITDSTQKEELETDRRNKLLYDITDFKNVDLMRYFRYGWGFGFKIQIPMMPLRFWFGRKLEWVGKDQGYFKEISGFNFQFGIGDMRF